MPPRWPVPRLTEAPPIEGRWDVGTWAAATVVGPFLLHDGRSARQPTRARLGYNDTCLYVAFHCVDDDIWGTLSERDTAIYNEEVVEVYLDPSGDGRTYIEIEVSPRNVVLDLVNTWAEGTLRWDPAWDCAGLRTAVLIDGDPDDPETIDRAWSVTLAIPFDGLGVSPPRPGDEWRANLYRIDHDRRRGIDEFQAWSPTQEPGEPPFFNVPARFATLLFETG